MLGKGLESLIPQKGDQNGAPAGMGDGAQNNGAQNGAQNGARPETPSPAAPVAPIAPAAAAQGPHREHHEERREERREERHPKREETPEPESIFHIEVEKIRPNPDQPRRNFNQEALRDLANSIREFGFLQPLVVSRIEKEMHGGVGVEYQLIAGGRRYLAAKMLGLRLVPAIIRNVSLEREKLELAVIENIQRENLNPIETARAFQRLQEEFRMTQREIASKLGKSREVVANTVRLLDLPEHIRTAIEKGELSESHGRLLLAVTDPGAQKALFEDITERRVTTRELKDRVQRVTGAGGAGGVGAGTGTGSAAGRRGRPRLEEVHLPPEMRAMQESLSNELGAPVEIHKGGQTGKITITFYSEEELENILRRLQKEGL